MTNLKNLRVQVERAESSDASTADILVLLTQLLNYLIAQEQVRAETAPLLNAVLDRIATALE